MFDFKKAFDLIDHTILIDKIRMLDMLPNITNWIIDFLILRKQRVKIDSSTYSEWLPVISGVPQGTKLGPWLFALMINDLVTSDTIYMWKYVDDTSITEVVEKGHLSNLQFRVDDIATWAETNKMVFNTDKCKELRISFTKNRNQSNYNNISIDGKGIDLVSEYKILGLIVSQDLKWNAHVQHIVLKASKRIYLLKELKRASIPAADLLTFYTSCIRPVLEYACVVYHHALPAYLVDDIEYIQKRCLRIIYSYCLSYLDRLSAAGITSLVERRDNLCHSVYQSISGDSTNRLFKYLPPVRIDHHYNLRNMRSRTIPRCKTDRLNNSFFIAQSLKESII